MRAHRGVLPGPLERYDHGACITAGQPKELPRPLSAQPRVRSLIEHQVTLRTLVEDAGYLGAVEVLDEAAA